MAKSEKQKARHKVYMRERYASDAKHRESHKLKVKTYKKNNKMKVLARTYKFDIKDVEKIFAQANNKCEICNSEIALCLDHAHDTNTPRGILCKKCNLLVGRLGDTYEKCLNTANKILAYLSKKEV